MAIVLDGTNGITTSGNNTLGDASTDTLNVGNGGLVKDASGNVGIGLTPNAWGSNVALQMAGPSMWGSSGVSHWSTNTYFDGSNYKYIANGTVQDYYQLNGAHVLRASDSGTAGASVSTFANLIAVTKGQSLALQGASSQTGTGISFPASQNASSDANTLDDYEEGTWTPVISFGSGSVSSTSIIVAKYVKIGKMVTVNFRFSFTGASTASNPFVNGLPFAVENNISDGSGVIREYALTGLFWAWSYGSGTAVSMQRYDNNNTIPNAAPAFSGTFTYFTS